MLDAARLRVGLLLALAISFGSCVEGGTGDPDLLVDASSWTALGRNQSGFINGYEYVPPAASLLSALAPSYWRIPANGDSYSYVKSVNPSVRVTLQLETFAELRFGIPYSQMHPWEDWTGWETFVRDLARIIAASGVAIDYYEIWNEPDSPDYLDCPEPRSEESCYALYLELATRTARTLRSVIPSAKIVAPDLSRFSADALLQVILDLRARGVHVDAVSWHELDEPELLAQHVAELHEAIARSGLAYVPAIHVSEYLGWNHTLVPGADLRWLEQIEASRIDWATRSCWDAVASRDGGASLHWVDACYAGVGGLLLDDASTPQHVYWVRKKYAELGSRRLRITRSDAGVFALASSNAARSNLRMLIARLEAVAPDPAQPPGTRAPADEAAPESVEIRIDGLPASWREAELEQTVIPNESQYFRDGEGRFWPVALGFDAQRVAAATTVRRVTVSGGTVLLRIPGFGDGDVVALTLRQTL